MSREGLAESLSGLEAEADAVLELVRWGAANDPPWRTAVAEPAVAQVPQPAAAPTSTEQPNAAENAGEQEQVPQTPAETANPQPPAADSSQQPSTSSELPMDVDQPSMNLFIITWSPNVIFHTCNLLILCTRQYFCGVW